MFAKCGTKCEVAGPIALCPLSRTPGCISLMTARYSHLNGLDEQQQQIHLGLAWPGAVCPSKPIIRHHAVPAAPLCVWALGAPSLFITGLCDMMLSDLTHSALKQLAGTALM